MADFSTTEKTNVNWKHSFNVLGTYNGSGAAGKYPYEEVIHSSHIIFPEDIWADPIPLANSLATARSNALLPSSVVEDRSDGVAVTLVASGSDWTITSIFEPQVGYQVTNVHPNPTWIRSITNVTSLGGGSYQITLNSNSGVSAGAAVLHRRVFLTLDTTSNGQAWFARQTFGDSFSNLTSNFILPQKGGRGYAARLFQANGTEVVTTAGAWIFNYQKGLILFGAGYNPTNMGYVQPMYVECFRYIGNFGGGTGAGLPAGNIYDTLRYDGSNWVTNSGIQSDGANAWVNGDLSISGHTMIASGVAPASSSASGVNGELRWDNQFLYLHTQIGWGRVSLGYFS